MFPSGILSPLWLGYALSAGLGMTVFGVIRGGRTRRWALAGMVPLVAAFAFAVIPTPSR